MTSGLRELLPGRLPTAMSTRVATASVSACQDLRRGEVTMPSRAVIVAFVASAATLLAGCQVFGQDEPAIDRWDGLLSDLRFQWSAEPGIDLLTEPAVPVRAYLESRWLAQSTGNLDYAYPGFTGAVPEEPPDADEPLRPNTNHQLSRALVGNSHRHILALDRANDTVTATVCVYNYTVAAETDGGEFESVARGRTEPRGTNVERVLLSAPPEGRFNLPPQAGFSPAPSTDVFGAWTITGDLGIAGNRTRAEQWPTFDADRALFAAAAPDSAERQAFLLDGTHPGAQFPT